MKLISWIFIVNQILFTVIMTNSYMLSSSSLKNDKNYVANNFELNQTFNRIKKSVVIKKTELLWNDGIIPYEFDNVYNGTQRRLILQAMRRWEESTCIKFVKRHEKVHRSYLFFIKMDCGCCSTVGKLNDGKNIISIDDECSQLGTILHELGHAIGLLHEHLHPDRDDYVHINFGNIPDADKLRFKKLDPAVVDTLGQPYDYSSIMHYSGLKQTIIPLRKINGVIPEIGQRIKLSKGDILAANLLYNCSKCGGKTLSSSKAVFNPPSQLNKFLAPLSYCEWTIRAAEGERISLKIVPLYQNISSCSDDIVDYLEITDGYLPTDPVYTFYRSDLKASYTGNNYLILKYSKVSHLNSTNSFLVEYETICQNNIFIKSNHTYFLESPNYPEAYEANKDCSWNIQVPDHHAVSIHFYDFDLRDSKNCVDDFFEIQHSNLPNDHHSEIHCGKVDNFVIFSAKKNIFIKFVSKEHNSNNATGFSAAITAVPI